mmetsp:Transcript_17426/g.57053  ORF Transcript_17426/g.57053 Transcript_17426/m.57053 type:complete len:210 (+) Transcript_17426:1775-2404(+)
MSTESKTSVSNISAGGSHQRVASAAAVRTSTRVRPSRKTGISGCTSILPSVSVPVLSKHKTSIPARSSTAPRRVTMMPSLANLLAPSASVVEHTTCIATGVEATNNMTQKLRAPRSSSPRMRRNTRQTTTIAPDSAVRLPVRAVRMRSKRPSSPPYRGPAESAAVRPKKVSFPVAITTASASPLSTVVPIFATPPSSNTIGNDSPVNRD